MQEVSQVSLCVRCVWVRGFTFKMLATQSVKDYYRYLKT